MAFQAGLQQVQSKTQDWRKFLESVYVADDKVNQDAVNLGLYLIKIFTDWEKFSGLLERAEDRAWLDYVVTGIFSGEGFSKPEFFSGAASAAKGMAENIPPEHQVEFMGFLLSVYSSEILSSPFVQSYGVQIATAVALDCFNEMGKRLFNTKGDSEAFDALRINEFQSLIMIAHLVGGMDKGLEMSVKIKGNY